MRGAYLEVLGDALSSGRGARGRRRHRADRLDASPTLAGRRIIALLILPRTGHCSPGG